MLYKLSVSGAVLALVLAGYLQRSWTGYYRTAPALAEAAERIQGIPLALGSWRGQTLELDAADTASAGYTGGVWRRYEDPSKGIVLSMLLVCGRPGPVSVHTPDVCYGGAGYKRMAEPGLTRVAAQNLVEPAAFWRADFDKPSQANGRRLRIFWSWYDGERWQAVENPRLTFMYRPVLYKLYVVCEITPDDEARKMKACTEFMNLLLPELQKQLAPTAPTAAPRPEVASEDR